MILRDQNAAVAPLIETFSFLAIATSFIGFVLGLADFFLDALSLPGSNRLPAYGLTLVPPYICALAFPGIFFQALDLVRPDRYCVAPASLQRWRSCRAAECLGARSADCRPAMHAHPSRAHPLADHRPACME